MQVNRSGYYKWLNRCNKKNVYEIFREFLYKKILDVHQIHKVYGYRSIASVLRNEIGNVFSDNLIHKICKHHNIKSKAKHYQWKKSGDEHVIYSNKVSGNWNVSKPLEIVVSDMTNISYRGRKVEWTFIVDVFNNSIIASSYSYKNGDPKPYYDCLDQLKNIIKNEEITYPVLFHTDQGSVYSSKAYNLGISNYNIERSMSKAGTPTDNPIIESLNGWIKSEIYLDYHPATYDNIEEFFEEYIYHFNYDRPAFALKYKNPAQFTTEQGFKCFF